MADKLYSVNIRWVKTPMKTTELEPIFNLIGDWIRYNGFTWFVSTSRTADEIYEALKTQITTEDSIVIMLTDPKDRSGWVTTWIVEWLIKQAAKSPS
ncbi:MAG TPA: hypothetical protein VFC38_09100 [Stellaceae bacterium]|nr:hypothetical protein [Stellaceae bacterium]